MRHRILVIGASAGGLRALETLLGGLPGEFPLPVVIVQHREKKAEGALTNLLAPHSPFPVREAEDKEEILRGVVYLAPANYHLLLEQGHFALSTEAPVRYARPSIDLAFSTAAALYGEGVVAVVLTGANDDGACGLAEVKRRGGVAVVQDPETAKNPVMPMAAIAATAVDAVLPLEKIGPFLAELCGVGGAREL